MSHRARTFDDLYRADPDPWQFESNPYEAAKYAKTLEALPQERFRHGLEIGCSIGVLTAHLAERCRRLTAVDVSALALQKARARCAGKSIDFVHADIPTEWPTGTYDLIVFSEILYFLEGREIERCAERADASTTSLSTILLVNYLGPCDRPLDGDAAAERFIATARALGFVVEEASREPLYRIDVLRRMSQRASEMKTPVTM